MEGHRHLGVGTGRHPCGHGRVHRVALRQTPEEISSYADAVAGGALYAINGKVEGIDSLGGVIQDEFGFMAAILLPLLGISLIAGSTRREEEAGRLELLLSGRIGRRSPVLAALIVTTATVAAVVVAFIFALVPADVPASAAILYAASLGGLAFVFAGLAALITQVTLHARGVYFGGVFLSCCQAAIESSSCRLGS